MWEIDTTYIDDWIAALNRQEYRKVSDALLFLAEHGPSLGRPFVDTLRGSAISNLKELRPRGSNIRIIFAFDYQRAAILLVAGDKTNRWNKWYRENIPLAEARWNQHLRKL